MEQDSLEDYIKVSQTKDEPSLVDERIQSYLKSAEKKRECESRAMKIVEFLVEGTVCGEIFLKTLQYLNPMYYQDIVEERSITKICGYPLCSKKIPPFSAKRYAISTKSNKVYDLNDYGYFCSIHCFDSSNHIKNQILDSPLWLRDNEEVPVFNLLRKDKSNFCHSNDLKTKQEENNENFTPISSFAEMSLDDFIHFEAEKTENKEFKKFELSSMKVMSNTQNLKQKDNLEVIEEKECEDESISEATTNIIVKETQKDIKLIQENESLNTHIKTKCLNQKNQIQISTTINKPSITDKTVKSNTPNLKNLKALTEKIKNKAMKSNLKIIDPLPLKTCRGLESNNKNLQSSTKSNSINIALLELKFLIKNPIEIENEVRNLSTSWISLDTLMYVHGDVKIKKILDEKKLSDYFETLKVGQLEMIQQKKYFDICKKLHLQELLEEKWDNTYRGSDKINLLHSFSDLKNIKKENDVKVRTFYGGVPYETVDENFSVKETENEEEGVPAVLPIGDSTTLNASRRKILSNSLNKSIKLIIDTINYKSESIFSDLQDLTRTFKLNANNIVFKPIVSNYLALICIKILALKKDNHLKMILETDEAKELESFMLGKLPEKNKIVTSCLEYIQDVDSFIENYILSQGS